MKCFIEDFRELDIDELLAVNGGYGSSSRSYGKGSGGGDDSNSSTTSDPISVNSPQTSWEVWDANKDGRNSSGEITRPHDPYRDATRNSGQYKAPSFVPDNSMTKKKKTTLEEDEDSDFLAENENNDVLPNENVDGNDVLPDDGVNSCEQQNSLDPNVNSEDSVNNTTNPSNFEQRNFSDEYGDNFGDNACAATSLLNEISEEYTAQTGEIMTREQAENAMQAAVDAGYISADDAYINDWEGAANEMADSLGLNGNYEYVTDSTNASATIYACDTDGDGNVDHFVNDIGNGEYYDPFTGQTGNISDLNLATSGLGESRNLVYVM